jgi:hypothetical protein
MTQDFKVLVVKAHEAGKQHPATKWLKSTGTHKVESILSGATAALIIVAKPNKINPISILSPSKAFDDCFKANNCCMT